MNRPLSHDASPAVDPAAAAYLRAGAAGCPAVVLIHGLTASPTEVRPLALDLASREPDWTICAPLLPGHGTTPEHLARTPACAWDEAIAAEIDRLCTPPRLVALVGVSMGALLALRRAAKDTRVRALAMLAPTLGFRKRRMHVLPLLRLFMKYSKKSRRSLANHRAKGLFSYDRYPLDSLLALKRLSDNVWHLLPQIRVPTLLAIGALDRYVPLSAIRRARAALKTPVEYIECPRSGHILPHEPDGPELFNAVHTFLRAHLGAGIT